MGQLYWSAVASYAGTTGRIFSLWRVCVPRPTTCVSDRDLEEDLEELEQLQAAQPLEMARSQCL